MEQWQNKVSSIDKLQNEMFLGKETFTLCKKRIVIAQKQVLGGVL